MEKNNKDFENTNEELLSKHFDKTPGKIVHTYKRDNSHLITAEDFLAAEKAEKKEEKEEKKKTPAWKVFLTVVGVVASVCIVIALMWTLFLKDAVLRYIDENLVPTVETLPSVTASRDQNNTETNEQGLPVVSDITRKEKTFNFLVVGLNADIGNNTDTIMVANFDTKEKKLSVAQIPRDTYISKLYNFHKINSVFAAGFNSSDGPDRKSRRVDGMEELKYFVEQAFSIKIDFYILIDLDAFIDIIDSMGGLEVDVPVDMNYVDPEQDLYINIKAGPQVLRGYDAMGMVRNRKNYPDADYSRMNVQKIFISAFIKQLKKNLTNVSLINSLVQTAFNDVTTDLTLENCIYFAKQALDTDMSAVSMATMPTETVGNAITVLKTDCLDLVNRFLNVYSSQLTYDDFDPKEYLTNANDSDMYKTYLYNSHGYTVYTAEQVDNTSIDIPTW